MDIVGEQEYDRTSMSQFVVLYYVAATMLGLAALAISVIGTIRSRVSSYRLLVLFYGAFTAEIATLFVREYLYVNIADYSYRAVLATFLIASILALTCMASISLFYHRILAVRYQRTRDAMVLLAGCHHPGGLTDPVRPKPAHPPGHRRVHRALRIRPGGGSPGSQDRQASP